MSAIHEWDVVEIDARDWEAMIRVSTGLDPLTLSCLVDRCERELREVGVTGVRVVTPRWNAAGEPIGPEIRISFRFARMVEAVAAKVAEARHVAIDAEIERWGQ